VTWRVVAVGRNEHPSFLWPDMAQGAVTPKTHREIYLPAEKRFGSVPVYDRYALPPNSMFVGPAIVEERESTIAVPLASRITVLSDRTILVELDT
jgi:N-methylhydantoinase A